MGGVSDPMDVFGPVVAGIYAAVGYQVIDNLFKPRETSLFEKWWHKISTNAKRLKSVDKIFLKKLDKWVSKMESCSLEADGLFSKIDDLLARVED